MPRGSVPWPRRNGVCKTTTTADGGGDDEGGGTTAAVSLELATARGHDGRGGGRPADDAAGCGQTTLDGTVHLVDTCGRVIDIRPVPETSAATPLPPRGDDEDDDRRKQTTVAALTGCPSRVQNDLKHIPPGKPPRNLHFDIVLSTIM